MIVFASLRRQRRVPMAVERKHGDDLFVGRPCAGRDAPGKRAFRGDRKNQDGGRRFVVVSGSR